MEPTKKSLGPVIGIVVVVVLIVIAVFYVWGGKTNTALAPTSNPADMAAPTVAPVSKSDEINSIDADLQMQSLGDIDTSDLDTIK